MHKDALLTPNEVSMAESVYELQAKLLKTLAHPDRIRILEYLKQKKQCQCEMAPALEIEQYNFSRHLSALKAAGVIKTWKDGVRIMFDVTDPAVYSILDDVKNLLKMRIQTEQALIRR
jgi:ArsR family transcriptional regulator